MTVTDTRRLNMLLLREKFPSDAALARAAGTAPSYIWQVMRDPEERRKIGDDFARKVESRLRLPDGWMDVAHGEPALAEGALAEAGGAYSPAPLDSVAELVTSRLAAEGQTRIPERVRVALHLTAGDDLLYRIEGHRVILTRAEAARGTDDPFRTFDEWYSDADERAYAGL